MRALAIALAMAMAMAAVLTSAAVAATGTLDARRLALTERDVPPSAQRMSQRQNRAAPLPGGTGQAYTTTFQFRVGGRTQAVGLVVITAPSARVARRVYRAAVDEAKKSSAAALEVAPLGDEQFAALYGRPSLDETSALVWVRRNTVVWQIQVSSVTNPFGFSTTEARVELTRFALKQKQRVGRG